MIKFPSRRGGNSSSHANHASRVATNTSSSATPSSSSPAKPMSKDAVVITYASKKELPAWLQRRPISKAEMDTIESGGAL
jgi:hypothetical protein